MDRPITLDEMMNGFGEILDEMDDSLLAGLALENVPVKQRQFFRRYTAAFTHGIELMGPEERMRMENLMLAGYLVRLLEEKLKPVVA